MDRIVSNLTKWEVGQDLIACADLISEKIGEIRNSGFIEEANVLRDSMWAIGKAFNKLGSHGFGLPDGPAPRKAATPGEGENEI